MSTAKLIFLTAIAASLCGCTDQRSPIDDAYLRGDISSAQHRQLTRESNEKLWATQEARRRQDEQQPSNRKTFIFPQSEDDEVDPLWK